MDQGTKAKLFCFDYKERVGEAVTSHVTVKPSVCQTEPVCRFLNTGELMFMVTTWRGKQGTKKQNKTTQG